MKAVERKMESLQDFINQLINSKAKRYIGKIFLFGSTANLKKIRKDSDIDLLIFCFKKLNFVLERCIDAQMETYFKYSESIEPLVYPIEAMRNPTSYFLYRILRYGKEVYKMEEGRLKRQEAENYLALASEYLEGALENLRSKRMRIAIDTGYNAAELAAKAFLILEMDEIPSSHGGIVGEFCKRYIKTGKIEREIGRSLNRALDLRNKARYIYNAPISKIDAKGVISLAEKMIKAFEDG